MEIDLTKLKQLIAVARAGTLSQAAQELGITQPALSRNIALLEHRFRFKIFDRGRGGASLTPVGALVVEDAIALVRHASALERNLHLYGRGESGRIDFGMGPNIAAFLLRRICTHMLTTRPQVRMRCSLKTADQLFEELMNDSIEMMFCATDHIPPSPDLVMERIGEMTVGLLVRSDHPVASRGEMTMSELAAYPIAAATEHLDPSLQSLKGGVICDSLDILRGIVLQTDAVWLTSPEAVADDIAVGRLIEIKTTDLPFRRHEVGVVRLAARAMSPAGKAVADCARTVLAESSKRPEPRLRL